MQHLKLADNISSSFKIRQKKIIIINKKVMIITNMNKTKKNKVDLFFFTMALYRQIYRVEQL